MINIYPILDYFHLLRMASSLRQHNVRGVGFSLHIPPTRYTCRLKPAPFQASRLILAAFITLCLSFINISIVAATTTTTNYTYNNDGALTQVSTQVNSQAPTVQYLIWDNFTPDSQNPAIGTVTTGNGHILAYGASPDYTDPEQQFTYDLQERLQQVNTAQNSVSYLYHPTWMMASSAQQSGDTLHFYYHPGKNPKISNIEQASSGEVSGRLGPLRAFSEGGSQILIAPRKDVSGVYDPILESFVPYHYDPFGSEESSTSDSDYDIHNNPYQYAGEYKDPTWNGYYLRARWYKPEFHTFLSRDPESNLNRYGYTAGNPVSRVDPSGQSYKQFKKGMRPLSNFLHKVTTCKGCVAVRVLFAPEIGELSLMADPAGFYHSQFTQNNAFGIITTITSVALEVASDVLVTDDSYVTSYLIRLTTDAISGAGSSAAAATSHNFHRFNRRMFFQGLEYAAGSVANIRGMTTYGYRPFNKTLDDVMKPWNNSDNDLMRVIRVRSKMREVSGMGFGPLGDMTNLGLQHEYLIAVSKNGEVFHSEILGRGGLFTNNWEANDGTLAGAKKIITNDTLGKKTEYRTVGLAKRNKLLKVFNKNPLNVIIGQDEFGGMKGALQYSLLSRNCQQHVSALIKQINFVERPSLSFRYGR